MLRITEGDTWQEAFLKVLPERKNARPIVPEDQEEESSDSKSFDVCDASPLDTEVPEEEADRLKCDKKANVTE